MWIALNQWQIFTFQCLSTQPLFIYWYLIRFRLFLNLLFYFNHLLQQAMQWYNKDTAYVCVHWPRVDQICYNIFLKRPDHTYNSSSWIFFYANIKINIMYLCKWCYWLLEQLARPWGAKYWSRYWTSWTCYTNSYRDK